MKQLILFLCAVFVLVVGMIHQPHKIECVEQKQIEQIIKNSPDTVVVYRYDDGRKPEY